MNSIAIIGGGPAGLTALKSLIDDGMEASLFEQSADIGGQWNTQSKYSGVWDGLQTNSSRHLTVFSDFPHKESGPLYLGSKEIFQYLKDYSSYFALDKYIRLNTQVEYIEKREDGNYFVGYSINNEYKQSEIFSHVIIASGRFNKPVIPDLPGLDQFKGSTPKKSRGYTLVT